MYKLSRAAARDIEKTLERSTIDFGLLQTERYFNSLSASLQNLADNPELGKPVDYIKKGYRRFVFYSHVIFYRIVEQDVVIMRIPHKRMDITKHL